MSEMGSRAGISCPDCGSDEVQEQEGSVVSPYLNVYSCPACGWSRLRCGNTSCDSYMEAEPFTPGAYRYTCVRCSWTGTGPAWGPVGAFS